MANLVVALPEPHPEDDEDVVWGLSTASALWARGERRDAIVWLRRAVEAAQATGQPFRASELGLCVTALEEALSSEAMRLSASDIVDTVSQNGDEQPATEETTIRRPGFSAVIRASVDAIDLDMFEAPQAPPHVGRLSPSHLPSQAYRAGDAGVGSAARPVTAHPPPPPAPPRGSPSQPAAPYQPQTTPVPRRPSSPPQAVAPLQPTPPTTFVKQTAPPPPPSVRPQLITEPLLPSAERAPSAPPPPPSVRSPATAPHPAPLSQLPAKQSSIPPRPAHTPVPPTPSPLPAGRAKLDSVTNPSYVPARPAAALPSSDIPPPIPQPPPTPPVAYQPPAASAAPPPAVAPHTLPSLRAPTVPVSAASASGAPAHEKDADREEQHADASSASADRAGAKANPSQARLKPRPRTPILDPWSEDAEPAAAPRPARELVTASGDAFLVARRSPAQTDSEEPEEEVITSAVPLDMALGRRPVGGRLPPPPKPPQTAARAKPQAPPAGELPGSVAATAVASVTATGSGTAAHEADGAHEDAQPPVSQRSGTVMADVASGAFVSDAHEPQDIEDLSEPPASSLPSADVALEPAPDDAAREAAMPGSAAAQVPAESQLVERAAPAHAPLAEAPPSPEPERRAAELSSDDAPEPAGATRPDERARVDAPAEPDSEAGTTTAIAPVIAPASSVSAAGELNGRDLEQVDAFADLPEEMHDELARAAHVDSLAENEELSGFGAALVLAGNAAVCTTIVDTPAHRALTKTLVPSRGTLAERIPLRVVAGAGGARVAIWDQAIIDKALRACPWVMDELRAAADRLQALAGATMGPLGDLDEGPLGRILERLSLRILQPAEPLISAGNPLPGLLVVGAGSLELLEAGTSQFQGTAAPGDLPFAAALLAGQPASADVRAASCGALVLLGAHPVLRELFESTPELVALLAQEG
jgi:hypothetical protein